MSLPNPRVVTFGEMLLRLSPPRYETLLESPGMHANFGGCEANVAVALAHLGVRAEYVSVLADNAIGDAAFAALQAEGVAVEAVARGDGRMGVYFVELGTEARPTRVVYDRARSAFAKLGPRSFNWPELLGGADWFHGSGITPALGGGPAEAIGAAVAAARAANVPVSIDLNFRPALWANRDPRAVVERLVQGIDLLIGNAGAARAMLGVDADDNATASADGARDLAQRLVSACGVRRVALTRRVIVSEREHHWSASLYDSESNEFAHSTTRHVQVVDRVGGGDSFAAALIASLLARRPFTHALEFAVAASAHKLAVPGDWLRLSTADVERLLA